MKPIIQINLLNLVWFMLVSIFRCNSDCNLPPNIQYVSRAYNILYGNPYTVGTFDEGFTKPIFDLSNCSNGQKWDNYDVPNGANIVGVSTCVMNQQFNAMSGSQSYYSSISESVSISGGANDILWDASFSASEDYQHVQSQTSSQKSVAISSYAKCGVYEVALNTPYDAPKLSQNFIKSIENMPLNYSDNPSYFFQFLDVDFGTHYLSALYLGGRYGVRSMFSSYSYSSFSSSNLDIKQSASFSTLFVGGSESSMTDIQKQQASYFMSDAYDYESFFVGGKLPSDGNGTTWQKSLYDSPMPMWYKLEGIMGLLIPSNFPSINATELEMKKSALKLALNNYCTQVAVNVSKQFDYTIYCNGLPPDPGLPGTSIFRGIYSPNSYKNPYTQGYNCPAHFQSLPISLPVIINDQGETREAFICLNTTQKFFDAMDYYGGIYQTELTDRLENECIVENYLTGNCGCFVGMTWHLISRSFPGQVWPAGYAQYFCWNGTIDPSSSILGGFYNSGVKDPYSSCYIVDNPYTNTQACPPGFTAYPTLDYCCGPQGADPKENVCDTKSTQYLCINNIYS